jgi:hypothetical protein
LSALRETRPPVPEDRPAREARRQHASKKKQTKETAKKRAIRKAKEAEALKKLRRQQTISGEDDDSSGETTTGLGDLPDIRPLLEPIRGHPPRSSWLRHSRRRRRRRRRRAPRWEGPLYPGPSKRGQRRCAVVLNRTAERDTAWVQQVEAAKGRLRRRQGSVDAMVVAGPDPAV